MQEQLDCCCIFYFYMIDNGSCTDAVVYEVLRIGSTLLEEEILHWSTHPVIARLRHLLNETMAGLSAPDPDTDENVIHDEEMGKNHVNVDLHGSKV